VCYPKTPTSARDHSTKCPEGVNAIAAPHRSSGVAVAAPGDGRFEERAQAGSLDPAWGHGRMGLVRGFVVDLRHDAAQEWERGA